MWLSPLSNYLHPPHQELTPCLVQSSVTLSVPMDAPVTFSTELVSVSWSLRFEFVIAPPESRWNIGGEAVGCASRKDKQGLGTVG